MLVLSLQTTGEVALVGLRMDSSFVLKLQTEIGVEEEQQVLVVSLQLVGPHVIMVALF